MLRIGIDDPAAVEEISRKAFRLVETWLPAASITAWCWAWGHRWRERHWTPALTLWACVLKHLHVPDQIVMVVVPELVCHGCWVFDGVFSRIGAGFGEAPGRILEF